MEAIVVGVRPYRDAVRPEGEETANGGQPPI